MIRRLALALGLICWPAASRAQTGFTKVSAQVLDPNNVVYAGCTGNASFVPAPTATTFPTLSGSVFNTVVVINSCDSAGNMTITLADNNLVSDGHPTGQQASQWKFAIQSQDGKTGFFCTVTITGATQTITTQLKACAPPLILAGGVAPGTPTNLAFYQTPTQLASTIFNYLTNDTSQGICFNINFTCVDLGTFGPASQSAFFTFGADGTQGAIMLGVNDSATNTWQIGTSFKALNVVDLDTTSMAYFALNHLGGTSLGGNCFNGGASSLPCAVGYASDVGDDAVTRNPNANTQDAVGFLAGMTFNRASPAHLGSVAGFLMDTPAFCSSTGLGVRPCGAATENAVNLWGMEIQDLQTRGTTQTAGIHIESQTNPNSNPASFAIKVETGGGPIQGPIFQSASATPALTGTLRLASNVDAIEWRNNANNNDVGLSKNTSDVFHFGGSGLDSAGGFSLNGTLLFSPTAPTVTAGFNTGSISTPNGTAAFSVIIGVGAAVSTGTVGLSPAAPNFWDCYAQNVTRGAVIQQSGSTTTSVTFTNLGTTFAATNWTNGDSIHVYCYPR